MTVYLWFDKYDIDEENNKVMFNVLVCELFVFVLRLSGTLIRWGVYALSKTDIVFGVDCVERGHGMGAFHTAIARRSS